MLKEINSVIEIPKFHLGDVAFISLVYSWRYYVSQMKEMSQIIIVSGNYTYEMFTLAKTMALYKNNFMCEHNLLVQSFNSTWFNLQFQHKRDFFKNQTHKTDFYFQYSPKLILKPNSLSWIDMLKNMMFVRFDQLRRENYTKILSSKFLLLYQLEILKENR